MKKGYTILSVLGLSLLVSLTAVSLYDATNTQTKITHNQRLYNQARANAQSGLTHFVSERHHYEDLAELGEGKKEFVLLNGALNNKNHYQVKIKLSENDIFEVTSQGYVIKNKKVLSSAALRATFQSNWISESAKKKQHTQD